MDSVQRPAVLVTHPVFQEAVKRFESFADVTILQEAGKETSGRIKKSIEGKKALLTLVTDRVDAELMDAAGGSLLVIGNCAVGYDNIDLEAATQRGIQVSNTPGVLTEATADLAWALILSVSRKIAECDRHVRNGRFEAWGLMDFLGRDVCGATLGILGMGRIGQAVARRAYGFRMRVLYTSRSDKPLHFWEHLPADLDMKCRPRRVPMETLLKESDFLSIHVPLSESTVHLIGQEELGMMKSTSFLINTARGKVVDEQALVRALREDKIAGAGLDVYENEPQLAEGLAELENVVLLPHIGSATQETRLNMVLTAVENILEGLKGRRVPNLVNTDLFPEE